MIVKTDLGGVHARALGFAATDNRRVVIGRR